MIALLLFLVIVGVGMFLLENYVPMSPPFKVLIRVVVVICVILYLLKAFGIADIPIR